MIIRHYKVVFMVSETSSSETLKITNRDQAEAATALLVTLQMERNHEATLQNVQMLEARKHGGIIAKLDERMSRYHVALEDWARSNREDLGLTCEHGQKKSIELRHGVLGFKFGNRMVKLLEGWTDALALKKLKQLAGKAEILLSYVRVKEEINRVQILNDTKPEVARLDEKTLKRFGLCIAQEESFFIDLKIESAQPAQK